MSKLLIVMRGLPWTGKSYRAAQLVEGGVIYSTDEYFYKILKPEIPDVYSFNPHFLHDAHRWNRVRAQKAIEEGVTPIIIDNTNTTPSEPKAYCVYAHCQDYEIRVEEPTSERWIEIRELLQDKRGNKQALKKWAKVLEEGSKSTHSVPAYSIEKMMWRWHCNLTPEEILNSPDYS